MSTYPTTPAPSFPVTAALEFDTGIATGQDGTEQRWMRHAGRASWTLSYPHLNLAERDVLLDYFVDRKGSALLFDFPFLGTTYTDCFFDADELTATESEPTYYAMTVKICKVLRGADSGTLASDFPALANGNPTQRPYTHGQRFNTVSVRTEGGRSAYSNRATPLRTWTAGGSILGVTDASAIWNMFSRAQGRYRSFGFTDPDSAEAVTVRFGADVCEWRFNEAGSNAVQVTLQEIAA